MTVPRLVAACLAGSVLVASAHAQGLSASDVKARDFSFQGIPFGCSIEQFKTKYPDAELLPDPAGKGKTLTTAADRRLNAVRYCVKQKRDREGVPSSHFYEREYLFVDDKMVEFCGLDFFSDADASKRYMAVFIETLGDPAERLLGENIDGMRFTWRFPNVGREFVFMGRESVATLSYVGRDTAAIAALERKRAAAQDAP